MGWNGDTGPRSSAQLSEGKGAGPYLMDVIGRSKGASNAAVKAFGRTLDTLVKLHKQVRFADRKTVI